MLSTLKLGVSTKVAHNSNPVVRSKRHKRPVSHFSSNCLLLINLKRKHSTTPLRSCGCVTRCQDVQQTDGEPQAPSSSLMALLSRSNDVLPYAVILTTVVALCQPTSFVWFTSKYFAPALGFLMFAVGVNLKPEAFYQVFTSPKEVVAGNVGQWVIKPLLGVLIARLSVTLVGLPTAVGTGVIMVSIVSGAQLSTYATFLAHPDQAPLAIVLTALSTATGAVLTPLLALLLLGQRIPVDAKAMSLSIVQIVIAPVVAGLTLRQYVPNVVGTLRPLLGVASLLVTCACVGAPICLNSATLRSPGGSLVLAPVLLFHTLAFVVGYYFARASVARRSTPCARCICLVTGMQSSLLALLLASKFFDDPLVLLPCAVSVPIMTLGGFLLVTVWKALDARTAGQATSSDG